MRLTPARCLAGLAAFWTAQTWIGPVSQRPYACWDARAGVGARWRVLAPGLRVRPLPRAWPSRASPTRAAGRLCRTG